MDGDEFKHNCRHRLVCCARLSKAPLMESDTHGQPRLQPQPIVSICLYLSPSSLSSSTKHSLEGSRPLRVKGELYSSILFSHANIVSILTNCCVAIMQKLHCPEFLMTAFLLEILVISLVEGAYKQLEMDPVV